MPQSQRTGSESFTAKRSEMTLQTVARCQSICDMLTTSTVQRAKMPSLGQNLHNFTQKRSWCDKPESCSATHSKNCIFIAQKKVEQGLTQFLHIFTLSGENPT